MKASARWNLTEAVSCHDVRHRAGTRPALTPCPRRQACIAKHRGDYSEAGANLGRLNKLAATGNSGRYSGLGAEKSGSAVWPALATVPPVSSEHQYSGGSPRTTWKHTLAISGCTASTRGCIWGPDRHSSNQPPPLVNR